MASEIQKQASNSGSNKQREIEAKGAKQSSSGKAGRKDSNSGKA